MSKKEQGLSLLDIGPLSETVEVGTGKLEVYGVSARGIFEILNRFPEVSGWFRGAKVDVRGFVTEVPDAISAVIAIACRTPKDKIEEAEAVAEALPFEIQLDILDAVVRLTFKDGFGPFVKRIVALSDAAQSVNYGRVVVTKSPAELKSLSPQDTGPTQSGT